MNSQGKTLFVPNQNYTAVRTKDTLQSLRKVKRNSALCDRDQGTERSLTVSGERDDTETKKLIKGALEIPIIVATCVWRK
jgi:hypothetical protein